MGAQLSRIGPARGLLVVAVCMTLSLVGLTRSGLAGEADSSADHRDPVVLAPPKVKDPDLGAVPTGKSGAARTKTSTAGGTSVRVRRKTCVTPLGETVKLPRGFACPKAIQVKTPRGQRPTVPQQGAGGGQSAPSTTKQQPRKKITRDPSPTQRQSGSGTPTSQQVGGTSPPQ